MTEEKQFKEKEQVQYQLHIMKALGWYINIHKDIKQREIAKEMNVDPTVISYAVIPMKDADYITEENYLKSNKRLISISRAKEICRCMNTTLPNVLYYYQFRNVLDNLDKINIFEKMSNKLNDVENKVEKLTEVSDIGGELLQELKKGSSSVSVSVDKIISHVNHPDFLPWFGKYYCYFSSTSSDEAGKKQMSKLDKLDDDTELQELYECSTGEYIFCGIMNIYNHEYSMDGLCHVDFKFLANPDERLIKRYSGILMLSANTKAVFCELTSNDQGEKTYLILEKQDLGKEQPQVRCCMAMVLTYSSKVHRRRPCCERMIISNTMIRKKEEYESMKAYLRMNDSTIRITQWGYDELLKDIRQSDDSDLQKIAELFPDLHSLNGKNVTIENCAFIPESFIYTLNSLTKPQKRKFEILLRNHSIAPWYSKTKATKADTLFKLLNSPYE
ncbi:MAG: hypothetical protein HDQ96_16180 [Lachnospiraceae bacterium]|nr:hypothetical protein [Lachnospiraceae bacterium]